jgi:O-acetylserine/cysteine efflux transporter
MPIIHLMLALAVVFIWGTNFVVIKWGLAEFDPFLFAALRFALCIVPWILFIPRPPVAWSRLAWFGVLLGAGQFGLLFLAMRADVTPGLASLVMQSQVFFTIGLSMALQGERVKGPQYLAMILAVAGIAVIGWQSLGSGQASVTPLGLSLLLCAAACWAIANLVARRAGAFAHSRQHRRLGVGVVAGAGQYPVRFRGVELVAGALSGSHGGAHGLAGAGIRHECFRVVAG